MKQGSNERSNAANGHRCQTTLGEITESAIQQAVPDREFVYLDIGSVDRESKYFNDLKVLSPNDAPSRARQVVKQGDVLVSMTRPNLNAVAMVPDRGDYFVASTGFHVLRSHWVDPKYLYYLVQSEAFIEAMSALVQGALYPAVRPKDIAGFEFELPPQREQTRIVEKLEELLSDLDAGMAELKAAQRKLAQYRQSLLKAAVEGALTADWRAARARSGEPQESGADLLQRILTERRARWEAKQLAKYAEQGKTPPKGWQAKYPEPFAPDTRDLPKLPEEWVWASIDQLTHFVRNGISRTPNTEGLGLPILRINAVRPMLVQFSEFKHIDVSESEVSDYFIENGDLLATRYNGSVDLLGVFGLVRELPQRMLYPDKLIRMCPVLNDTLGAWIEAAASSGASRTHVVRKVKTTAGQTGIAGEDIKKMPIPLPPLEEQTVLQAMLLTLLDSTRDQLSEIDVSRKQAEAQRKNILKAAFAGQLVPQDPNDEPASALLERIRADRETNTPSTVTRGQKSKKTAR